MEPEMIAFRPLVLAVVLCAAAAPMPLAAQTPSAPAPAVQAPAVQPAATAETISPELILLAREYYDITQKNTVMQTGQQAFDGMMRNMSPEFRGMFDDAANAALKQAYGDILTRFYGIVADQAPALYARRFSADELRQLIAFYRTPLGQKLLRETPVIMGETLSIMAPHAQDMQQEISAAVENVLKESQARRQAQQKEQGDKAADKAPAADAKQDAGQNKPKAK
jgi:uncharacterized protein